MNVILCKYLRRRSTPHFYHIVLLACGNESGSCVILICRTKHQERAPNMSGLYSAHIFYQITDIMPFYLSRQLTFDKQITVREAFFFAPHLCLKLCQ